MNRRLFLRSAAALIGGLALDQAIPLGRVWSFPSQIAIPKLEPVLTGVSLADAFRHGDLVTLGDSPRLYRVIKSEPDSLVFSAKLGRLSPAEKQIVGKHFARGGKPPFPTSSYSA